MRKLTKADQNHFLDFLSLNKAANTFIFGNYFKYGLDSNNVDFLVEDSKLTGQPIKYVLMRYYNDYVFFAPYKLNQNELETIKSAICSFNFRVITGNEFSIRMLANVFGENSIRETHLMSLSPIRFCNVGNYESIRKLNEGDIEAAIVLLTSIDEFKDKFTSNAFERVKRMICEDEAYGIFQNCSLVSMLSITAKSQYGCMLTDICVNKLHRGRGLSRVIIEHASSDLFQSGVSTINLYADNPIATKIYSQIGFRFICKYLIMYSNKNS